MKTWLKYLLLGAILLGTTGTIEAQKLRFPTNVREIAGGYINKQPFYATLEAALNNVKPFATSENPYVFWIASDTVQIADWDSVFTESGLTMKDSIDVYYVAAGKIKWGGFGFGGSGSGGATTIVAPEGTTTHYSLWTWTGQTGLATWQTRLGLNADSIDLKLWELIVYTDSVYLYIENDTLKFRSGSVAVTGWNPADTTTVVRTFGNQSIAGDKTHTGGILFGAGGYLQQPAAYTASHHWWRTANGLYYYNGVDTLLNIFIDNITGLLTNDSLITWQNLNEAVRDSINAWQDTGVPHAFLTDTTGTTYTPDVTSGTPVLINPTFIPDFNGLTFAGDTLVVDAGSAGDYVIQFGYTLNVAATDDIQISFVVNGGAVHYITTSGVGAADYTSVTGFHYMELSDGDSIAFFVDNLVDNDDPEMSEINILITRIHR